MKKIIFSRLNKDLDNYVTTLFAGQNSWNLTMVPFEAAHLQDSEFYIFDYNDLKANTTLAPAVLNKYLKQNFEQATFLLMSGDDFEALAPLASQIIILDTQRSAGLHQPMLNMVGQRQAASEKQVIEGLDYLLSHSLRELQRVKKIHETLVPLRSETLKGLKLTSKYAAGEKSGGEFFDTVEGDKEILLILSHTTSYVLSSLIISEFDHFRTQRVFDKVAIDQFVQRLSQQTYDLINVDGHECSLFVARVDMKTLDFEGVNIGSAQLVSTEDLLITENRYRLDPAFVKKASFSYRLNRSEGYFLLSSGMRKNCRDQMGDLALTDFVKSRLKTSSTEVLNEIFFQLKKGMEGSFLVYDATGIYIEVDTNVIFQV